MTAPVKEHGSTAAARWRKQTLAMMDRLRPVIVELEAMLSEARLEWAELEKAEQDTRYLTERHRGPRKLRR